MKAGLGLKLTKYYAACVLLALEFLHENHIIFKDLKPENIVIAKDGTAKLTDFGISEYQNRTNKEQINLNSTPYITAPEVING